MASATAPTPAPITPALAGFDSLPDSAQVRLPVVTTLFGVSAPTVWRWSKSGRLPTPIKRGSVTTWNVGALRQVLAQPE